MSISLQRPNFKQREILKFSQANWDNIQHDLEETYKSLKSRENTDIDSLWKTLKTDLQSSINRNIPKKLLKQGNKLHWTTNDLRKKMISYKRKLPKANKKKQQKPTALKKMKSKKNKDKRTGYT